MLLTVMAEADSRKPGRIGVWSAYRSAALSIETVVGNCLMPFFAKSGWNRLHRV
jgi:hypothetical protein